MRFSFRAMILFLVAAVCLSTALSAAGQSGTSPTPEKKAATSTAKKAPAKKVTVEEQLQQLTNKLSEQQTQIQQQQSQIQQLQQTNTDLQKQVQQQTADFQNSMKQASQEAVAAQEGVKSLHTTVTDLQSTTQATANALLENKKGVQALENPLSIRYKGITITPGGWLESTFFARSRNENADITTNFGAAPFPGVANSNLSEFRASARGSRAILVAEGMAGSTKLTGYMELDFLGQPNTANQIETNSFSPRQRQLWMQAELKSGWTFTAGQFWSLMTTDRKGIATRAEFIPTTIDGSYVVGYTYARQNTVRFNKNFSNKTWAAFEIANSETTYAASYTPSNLFGFENSTNALSPNGSTVTYGTPVNVTINGVSTTVIAPTGAAGFSTNLSPDFIGKVAFEPGFGHYEIKGLLRTFRDRYDGSTNYSVGGGIGWAAILPVKAKKVDFVFEGLAGEGIGRYGAANQPDVTITPKGQIEPLPAIHALAGFELHPNPKFDVYVYGGDEYVDSQRYSTINAEGKTIPAGYGSYLVNNTYCGYEVIPSGKPACGAQNKNLGDGTTGFWYRIYKGPFGTVQYGAQFEYVWRNAYSGVGGAPSGSEIVGLTSIRYYLP